MTDLDGGTFGRAESAVAHDTRILKRWQGNAQQYAPAIVTRV
jgi:hypothetical protein